MIIAEKLLHMESDQFTKLFTVAIQLGAILAVVVLYYKKFFEFSNWKFYLKLIIGIIPAIILGLLFSDLIDELLESTTTVAISLLLGGIVLVFIDKLFKNPVVDNEKEVSFKKSFIIGIWQCLAMVPGVSRSAATIIGGMQQKLTRSAAAEFSFFLAVPTMFAATAKSLYTHYKENGGISQPELMQLAIGNIVAFVVALIAIKFFIDFLKKYGFRIWGIYRIILGIILLILIYTGNINP